ncbi:MAG: VWA domain-containing protein [Planctomycetota bacterium]
MTHVHLPLTPESVLWPLPWVWALLLLLLLPLLWMLWQWRSRRAAIRFSDLSNLRAAGGTWSRRIRLILPTLRIAALGCLIVAVARPQRPDESNQIFAEGIAIQMVVDTSGSMRSTDLSPPDRRMTRLDVVKDVFRRFVMGDGELPGRPNDLVGMIRFALYADSICPLTLDHDSLLKILGDTHLSQGREGENTAIGDALALAVERLKDLQRTAGSGQQHIITSRVIILLTDGENNAGMVTPEQAGELAATYGIKVYTILAGTGQMRGPFRRQVDDRPLQYVAEVTSGKHFRAHDQESLAGIYAEIDELERTKTEERSFVHWGELARPWLVAAFICLGLQTFLDATRLRKIP